EAFAFLYSDRVRFDHRRKRWLIWNAPRWRPDDDGEIERLAIQAARERLKAAAEIDNADKRKKAAGWALQSESEYRRHAMLASASVLKPIADAGDKWDDDDWLLGCENGILDLRRGELCEGKPDDRITLTTHLAYDPNAKAERWDDFLKEVFGDDAVIDYIQRAAGYSLSGDVSEQVLFLCYGTGANGKSVFLAALRSALGDYAHNTPFSTFELLDNRSASNDVAALVGKRLLTASETRESARLNEARVKALTGGDPITARFLFAEFFTFQPKGKIWLAVNHKPNVSDDSYGFWRRIRLIPFTRVFDKSKADPRLAETLRIEADGILAWAVRGALLWQARGLEPPEQVTSATDEYRRESDPLENFLAECCIIDPQVSATAANLYKTYCAFAEKNGERPMTATAFGRRMVERGFTKSRSRGGVPVTYHGIGLLDTV
ncbi:MAG: DNA primase, partial [Chloroflexota bacterium]|nr:DNA primase [Chloroflexota bacterium]